MFLCIVNLYASDVGYRCPLADTVKYNAGYYSAIDNADHIKTTWTGISVSLKIKKFKFYGVNYFSNRHGDNNIYCIYRFYHKGLRGYIMLTIPEKHRKMYFFRDKYYGNWNGKICRASYVNQCSFILSITSLNNYQKSEVEFLSSPLL